jgi:hypothetical protein
MERVLALFIPIIAIGGVFTLIAMKMLYSHLQKTRLNSGEQQHVEHLAAAVDNLGAEFELLRSEFHELNEPVDFTERLLERPKTEE